MLPLPRIRRRCVAYKCVVHGVRARRTDGCCSRVRMNLEASNGSLQARASVVFKERSRTRKVRSTVPCMRTDGQSTDPPLITRIAQGKPCFSGTRLPIHCRSSLDHLLHISSAALKWGEFIRDPKDDASWRRCCKGNCFSPLNSSLCILAEGTKPWLA